MGNIMSENVQYLKIRRMLSKISFEIIGMVIANIFIIALIRILPFLSNALGFISSIQINNIYIKIIILIIILDLSFIAYKYYTLREKLKLNGIISLHYSLAKSSITPVHVYKKIEKDRNIRNLYFMGVLSRKWFTAEDTYYSYPSDFQQLIKRALEALEKRDGVFKIIIMNPFTMVYTKFLELRWQNKNNRCEMGKKILTHLPYLLEWHKRKGVEVRLRNEIPMFRIFIMERNYERHGSVEYDLTGSFNGYLFKRPSQVAKRGWSTPVLILGRNSHILLSLFEYFSRKWNELKEYSLSKYSTIITDLNNFINLNLNNNKCCIEHIFCFLKEYYKHRGMIDENTKIEIECHNELLEDAKRLCSIPARYSLN